MKTDATTDDVEKRKAFMQAAQKQLSVIEGSVDSVIYRNSENGYAVLDLAVGSDYVTVVGELGNIDVGEELRLTGEYVEHPKFGTQFKAEVCERKMPETSSAILRYLSSGTIKGIGPALAKKIVDRFGDDTLRIIEDDPGRLSEISGITTRRAEEIAQEFRRVSGMRTLMIFLSGFGLAPSVAAAAWKRWGSFSLDVIKDNPYALCRNDPGIDFPKAEQMAESLGIPRDSEHRAAAGLYYILSVNALNGHTCLPLDRLMPTARRLLGDVQYDPEKALENELDDDNVAVYEKNGRQFVYIYDYFRAEQYIADRLKLMKSCFVDSGEDSSALIDKEEQAKGITYAELQRKAIALALSRGFLILTGGPGTGKTTTLKAMISLYEAKGMKVTISAPTGRAAKRISDLTGYPAKTIHRMLEVSYASDGRPVFRRNENNPLPCDVMIIDEMSMVDVLLFESLLRSLKLSCRLILVGDSDQLPSVGAGNLLRDMTECGILPVVRLNEIFRQAQKSAIITNAHRIVNGEKPVLTLRDNDFFFIPKSEPAAAAELVSQLYSKRLPKAYDMSPYDDIQVLCPSRKGMLGVTELNKLLQNVVNPPSPSLSEVKSLPYIFRDGDKVMQTKNNYDIVWKKDDEKGTGIFNGDIGTIVKIRKKDREAVIDFEGRIAVYDFGMLEQLELAYAITVHKSQGSEFNAVILPLLGGFDKLYYRNLLYTAVTRAKKLLIIVGTSSAVSRMVENNRRSLRYSCLRDMLTSE